ncbi:hypothetical protein Pcinc_032848 [Petrolisthes cinctipes]|uniref:Ima1 N-terminal domain-containing protein n=1 Tax=Petrolisthes cinctipes TaxID=88211 RepID=A0AAE1K0K0_PETCI|nr:hypothetical protein Pcinc_032848 [Petrolisthes cinctipes]
MDYDMILPALAGASGVFAGCAVLYSKIRPRFPVKVNCWFCNQDTKVEFRYEESWVCPSCQQYNGFTEDGDYNRDLPAQYCESLNTPPHNQKQRSRVSSHAGLALGNGLCQTCNLNQTLKVRALADYTPIHPDNYDKEIEEYRKRLEKTYGLCRQCEATLHQTLGKQDSWLKPKLISWRLHQTSENKAKLSSLVMRSKPTRLPFFLHLLHLVGLFISLVLFLTNLHHLQHHSGIHLVSLNLGLDLEVYLVSLYKFTSIMVIAGLSTLLMGIFGSGKEMLLVSDAVSSFIWVGLLALCSSKQLIPASDYNSLQVAVSAAAVLFTLWTSLVPRVLPRTHMTRRNLNKSEVKSETSSANLEDSQCTFNASFSDELSDTIRPASVAPSDTLQPASVTPSDATPPFQSVDPLTSDLDATLGSLKISTPIKSTVRSHHSPSVSPRSLFSEKHGYTPKLNGSYCSQRNVVSPSRLSMKNITQSSWVAGGYWGHPVSPPLDYSQHRIQTLGSVPSYQQPSLQTPVQPTLCPLSRSSSQSSGFVSLGSGPPSYKLKPGFSSLPNSHPGSVCGDFDRGSILSEPVGKLWNYAPSLYPSDSASQCSHIRYRGQANSDAQSLYSSGSASPPSPLSNGCYSHPVIHGSEVGNSAASLYSSQNSIATLTGKDCSSLKSPWFAFFLGMSIAANGFLIALLYLNIDLQNLISGST